MLNISTIGSVSVCTICRATSNTRVEKNFKDKSADCKNLTDRLWKPQILYNKARILDLPMWHKANAES